MSDAVKQRERSEEMRDILRQYPIHKNDALQQRLHAAMMGMLREMSDSLNGQKEAFLMGHLDKVGTHTVYEYPQQWVPRDFGFASEQLICLAPTGTHCAPGLNPLTPEDARATYPHIDLVFEVVTGFDYRPFNLGRYPFRPLP